MTLLCEQPQPPRDPVQLEFDLESPFDKQLKAAFNAGYNFGHRDAHNRKMGRASDAYTEWANRPPTPGV